MGSEMCIRDSPYAVQLVYLEVLDGHARVSVDGLQRAAALALTHARHHLAHLCHFVNFHVIRRRPASPRLQMRREESTQVRLLSQQVVLRRDRRGVGRQVFPGVLDGGYVSHCLFPALSPRSGSGVQNKAGGEQEAG